MNKKKIRWSLLGGVGLTTTALINSLSLMAINPSSKTSNFTPPPKTINL